MRQQLSSLPFDRQASSAAEFAIVLPIMLIFLLGIIDVGRLMWTWNHAEKATQMGVRYAVVTDMVPNGLANYSFAINGGIPQGMPIPTASFGGLSCKSDNGTTASCTCKTASCGPTQLINNQSLANTAFSNIVAQMRRFMPELTATNVKMDYDNSGVGYSGDPNGPDVSPLVTVSIRQDAGHQITFKPMLLSLFNGTISLPHFSAALTMESGQTYAGQVPN